MESGSYVFSEDDILDENDREQLEALCVSFQEKYGTGIWVVAIQELGSYTDSENIEAYARVFLRTELPRFGADSSSVLILVSKEDRKVRLELGKSWGRYWDSSCRELVRHILTHFKQDKYADGLSTAILGLDNFANEKEKSSSLFLTVEAMGAALTPWSSLSGCVSLLFVVLGGYSLFSAFRAPSGYKAGSGGCGVYFLLVPGLSWLMVGNSVTYFTVIGSLSLFMFMFLGLLGAKKNPGSGGPSGFYKAPHQTFHNLGGPSSGGGFSGGSGGGGFSGGGGATGSW